MPVPWGAMFQLSCFCCFNCSVLFALLALVYVLVHFTACHRSRDPSITGLESSFFNILKFELFLEELKRKERSRNAYEIATTRSPISVRFSLVYLQVFVWCVGQEPDSYRTESWFTCGNTSFNFGDSYLGRPKWRFRVWVSFCCANACDIVMIFPIVNLWLSYWYFVSWDICEVFVFHWLASFWRRICLCSFCGSWGRRMVAKYVFSCYKL